MFLITPGGWYSYFHCFTDEENEAQNGKVICLESHRARAERELESSQGPEVCALKLTLHFFCS